MVEGGLVSVVIPTCERPALLGRCLDRLAESLAKSGCDAQVIVADASAGHHTDDLIRSRYPWTHRIARPRSGPALNRNFGASVATGRWLFFTDDDCIPAPDWVTAFLRAIASNPGVRVFEGCTTTDREAARLDEEAPVNPSGGYLWACNMAIERGLFNELGGFDEAFVIAGSEDSDLRWRLKKSQHRIVFVPDAVVCHPLRPSKGLEFQVKVGRAYLQLAERHPEVLGNAPWRTAAMNAGRVLYATMRDGARLRYRGIGYALGRLAIHSYFGTRAILRRRSSP